jgi:Tfp pilus assembly protein FimV
MTNLHLHFAKPTVAAKFSALCILGTLLFVLTNTVYAADTTADAKSPLAAPTYKVAESISIDRLIQKIYANSPLNTTVLRKALVDANPKVITGNPQQRVKGGTVIMVPHEGEIIRSTLTPRSAGVQEAADNNPSARDYEARKQWVRFP